MYQRARNPWLLRGLLAYNQDGSSAFMFIHYAPNLCTLVTGKSKRHKQAIKPAFFQC